MTDTLSSVSAIQAWIANVQTTVSQVPSAAQGASSPTTFANALAQVQAALTTPPGASPSATSTMPYAPANGLEAVFSASGASATGSQIVGDAVSYLGTPYQWGGNSPAGFDCSGFVQYVYGQAGIALPRTSQDQAQVGVPVASIADAEPGDLVFYPGSDGTASSPGHVGIYMGNGEMINAPQSGENVSITAVGDPVAIRRVLANGVATTLGGDVAGNASPTVPPSLVGDFVNAANHYGVPMQLLTAVAEAESNFDPNAISDAGAQGIMQLMPQTAAGLGVNPFDPAQAIGGAAQLLANYLNQFGSTPLALAAYNAGPSAVEQAGGMPPIPQTQAYVQQIMQDLGSASAVVAS